MFKIIKTSTYKKLVTESDTLKQKNMDLTVALKDALAMLVVVKMENHTLTAKKLPIKKSKNK